MSGDFYFSIYSPGSSFLNLLSILEIHHQRHVPSFYPPAGPLSRTRCPVSESFQASVQRNANSLQLDPQRLSSSAQAGHSPILKATPRMFPLVTLRYQ